MIQPFPSPGPEPVAGSTQRRHTHPLTPVLNSLRAIGVLLGAMFVFGFQGILDVARDIGGLWGLLVGLAVLSLILLAALALFYVQWLRTEYFFDDAGDFRVDSGVISRQERRVALSRLQSVDITRPLLGRLAGLSELRIEVAGSGEARCEVRFLTHDEAARLRAEIIARAAGVDPVAGEAPEAVLVTVPVDQLVISLLLRTETFALLAFSVLVVAFTLIDQGPAGLGILLFTGGLPLLHVVTEFARFYGFTVAESPDGLRLRHGLVSQQSQTVPPGRVQAVEVIEPLLWRRQGWVRVALNVAGRADSGDETAADRVLLPVAPAPVAAAIIQRVLPGVTTADLTFAPVPARARIRAPFQHRILGVAADDLVMATRRGFFTRRTAVIPHARVQSVGVTQGPWQRRLGLASVHLHSTPGPVAIVGEHRDAADARAIAEEEVTRAATARAIVTSERWMTARPAAPFTPPVPLAPADPPGPSTPPTPAAGGPHPTSPTGPDGTD